MSRYKPVSRLADFETLDESDVLLGYMDGFDDGTKPKAGHSRSYLHGWRNGMVAAGRMEPDAAYEALAAEFRSLPQSNGRANDTGRSAEAAAPLSRRTRALVVM